MKRPTLLRLWSAGAGAMDTITGLLLIFAPALTLRLLGMAPPPAGTAVFLGWIGVFVMSIGLSYGLALRRGNHGEAVWMFTTLVRSAVAVFVAAQVWNGALENRWILVAFADAAVAIVQFGILRAGWWKEVRP